MAKILKFESESLAICPNCGKSVNPEDLVPGTSIISEDGSESFTIMVCLDCAKEMKES